MTKKWLNYLIIMVTGVLALTLRLDVYPPVWFDEGYKLNAAYTLATENVYGTYTSRGLQPFDPLISSGPADIASIALSYKLFGAGVLQARLVIVFFALFALASLYRIAEYLYGSTPALICCLLVLAAPSIEDISFLMMGRQVMGEIPALALILFGLWMWFYSWETKRIRYSIISGFVIGLGLLSKNQVVFALLPAIGMIAAVRVIKEPHLFWIMSMPIFLILAVQGGWTSLGWYFTPESIRLENSVLLKESIQIHVVTGLFGSTLTTNAKIIIQFMLFGALTALLRLWFSSSGNKKNQSWAEAILVLFVIFTTIWFALFSIGWPRYTFFGVLFSWLFIGKLIWDFLKYLNIKITKLNTRARKSIVSIGVSSLAIFTLTTNIYPLIQFEGGDVQKAAQFIRENISDQELIETWEWELGALSGHMLIHHPHQSYLLEAIRQYFHENKPFELNYDSLQADPQYLITGAFSNWTRIYDIDIISENFEEIYSIGAYQIYQRIDSSESR